MNFRLFFAAILFLPFLTQAQLGDDKNKFTKADTLRGSLNENRDWWDVLRYDIEVKPDYQTKTIEGTCKISFKPLNEKAVIDRTTQLRNHPYNTPVVALQIDLQHLLEITEAEFTWETSFESITRPVQLKRESPNTYIAFIEQEGLLQPEAKQSIKIKYHGTPKEAKNAPWDGGWIWSKDSLGRPWMTVAVQGLGASAWFPCKDHQSDEPDNGASLTVIVPDTLVAVGNGKMTNRFGNAMDKTVAYKWEVKNPINSYNIVPSIGNYISWRDTLIGEYDTIYFENNGTRDSVIAQRKLDLEYWVLDYNLPKAKEQFKQVKPMLRCFEHWFGPYPFYEDGYKLVESPHLGMEHQSAIAYGNKYRNGYLGRDRSGTGWGSKWDFIIIHESGHEWFANNITTKDIADMWVHEGFTNYSETLYTEWLFGKQAGDEYNKGLRRNIQNDKPIIGVYGVNEEGSGDMYDKAGNMIHIIRKVIDNNEKFRQILRGMNKVFRHQTVTTQQIENFIIQQSGINFQKTFDQYLRTTQIPVLEFYFSKDNNTVHYRWTNCIKDFDLPLVINNKRYNITTKWNTATISKDDLSLWNKSEIEKHYYITAKQVRKP